MYNEQLKVRFIREYAKSVLKADICTSLFNAIEKYEVLWGADICTRTNEALGPVIDQLLGIRVQSKWSKLTALRDYGRWCFNNHVEGAREDLFKIDNPGLTKLRTQMVVSPTSLEAYLDVICEPVSDETIDIIYRCFYWMAYAGVPESEILELRCSDVDFENMVVHYGNEEAIIYREAVPALRKAVTLDTFAYTHPNYLKTIRRNRQEGDLILRGIKSTPTSKTMRVLLNKKSTEAVENGRTEMKLSFYRVWISGLFRRMYEREIAGLPVDFSGAASKFMEGKTYKLDSGRGTVEGKKRTIANDYLQDYHRWKAAFNL